MLFKVWPSSWTSLLSPPPPLPRPISVARRTHLKEFTFRPDTHRWLARWKQPASGLSYQWRQCCVTHRERTSCFTTLLLFLFQTAAIALSFFFFLQFVLWLWERRVGTTSGSHLQTTGPLWANLGLFCFTFCCIFPLDVHWSLTSTLVLLLWTLSPVFCVFEVSDE